MRSQPARNYISDDVVMTPMLLAAALARVLNPAGTILEPCAGDGAFLAALQPYGEVRTCEISIGHDFFGWITPVDWIITNPPWSRFRHFLEHSLMLAPEIAMLATVNHWWTRRRVSMVLKAGYGYKRLWLITPWPEEFPSSGFQLGLMHISKGYQGPTEIQSLLWCPRET